ncbi:DNA repair protein RecN [Flavobacterium branchiophilum]|uniref:DNA repair protein RecN n=1 Tax=Flavobacterium branchiophilum TaxID=55197 RepID=A0A543G8T5_9FLAO|nr:DNA repair protein RecN [Flavobacterium branchiophilum]OXA74192.1 DNA repair protein RecN [Flavobacterium branchiophilum] [Flavobacterium branchiophilum NBRC 15030 = ATCC 35035]TQM42384.1 DNA replication and repair protein RecN [Flavobacterium branchiophilum]GEM54654.1 DNA repair protein RecN [Flavobacterium branchiophilum NBRC 15030 = ATCC 35035]
MLISLSIQNFALIEKLNIDFSDKFSIITGETGAGKSILLGALGLIQGKRADLTSLKNKEEKCIVEATFNVAKYNLLNFFDQYDIDYQDLTLIRREILPSGKSRAFINDTPVTIQVLQEISVFLIDIHSQHQTSELSEESYQFMILDAIAQNQTGLAAYQSKLKEYKKAQNLLSQLLDEQKNSLKEHDYNTFLLEELLSAKLVDGEQELLEESFEQLNNVEIIKENLEKIVTIANEEQIGTKQNLREIKVSLQKIAPFALKYNQFLERIDSILIEMNDVLDEIDQASDMLQNDPEELIKVNQKLQNIYNLQKKHQVLTVSQLIDIQNSLSQKILSVSDLDIRIQKGSDFIAKCSDELSHLARDISQKRQIAIPILVQKAKEILVQLGMPNSDFKIELVPKDKFLPNGNEELLFLFAANKGTDFGMLKKVASGGELSRIMLAVKAILAQYSKLPTIIFDEIDTGVSGEIANKMGEIMKTMSQSMQVFAITHLPQIAAKGLQHYKVFKSNIGVNTISELQLLSKDDRIIEIAEMLSGKNPSESALTHAKALLNY